MNALRRLIVPAVSLVAGLLLVHCGKKGPPLPPLAAMTPRVHDLAAVQVGNEVHFSFTLPTRPDRGEVDYATLAVELWRKSADAALPAGLPAGPRPGAPLRPATPPAPRPAGAMSIFGGGAAQQEEAPADMGPGVSVFTSEASLAATLSGDSLFEALKTERLAMVDPLPQDLAESFLLYAVVLKTDVRKRGTVSNFVFVKPMPAPDAPRGLAAELREGAVAVSWQAVVLPPPPPVEAPSSAEGALVPASEAGGVEAPGAPAALGYELFRAAGDEPFPEEPVNDTPLTVTTWEDTNVEPGQSYSYEVRTVVTLEKSKVASLHSAPLSIAYRDAFAPAVPMSLRLIAGGTEGVRLIWNPNDEPDLGGYAIYRREPGGEWTRLDSGTERTATFVDRSASPAGSYDYAVAAYDLTTPPNESAKSTPESTTASSPPP